jgi:hypothetical protein
VKLSAEEHLQLGRAAIGEIQRLNEVSVPRVCFHFSPPPEVDASELGYGVKATYWPKLERMFADLQIDGWIDGAGGEFGFEVWEEVLPTEEWLQERLTQMLNLGDDLEHELQGWTYEPRGGPVVSAAPEVGVWNAATPEGEAKIQQLIQDAERGHNAEEGE